ncbi:MAG: hypothetical protein JXR96_08905, partial [Deltaproteobacteria bacterium]|nr:hypothetical protein [Deltaproteobacteria bacterium]
IERRLLFCHGSVEPLWVTRPKAVVFARNKEDEGIRAVRDVRKAISADFDDDPEKLVAHYILEQERHRDRLLEPIAARRDDEADRPSTDR